MTQIVIRDLRKEFGTFTAVRESSFTIEDGEFFMLLGPSGCGKTTTLRMIAGLELPTSGSIHIDGEDVSQVPASGRDIAFVFQMFALYPHMNVRKNIAYPLVSQGVPRAEVAARVAEVARILGIGLPRNSDRHRADSEERAFGRRSIRPDLTDPALRDTEPFGDLGVAETGPVSFFDRLLPESRQLGGPLLVERDQFGGPAATAYRVRLASDLVELAHAIHAPEFRTP